MPPAIAIGAAYFGTMLAGAGFLGLTGLAAALVGGVISMGINSIASSLFGFNQSSDAGSNPASLTLNQTGAVNTIPVVYGTRRVGGTRIYIGTTNSNKDLHLVYTLSEGTINTINGIYLNDELAATYSSTVAAAGVASGGYDMYGFKYETKYAGKAEFRMRNGADDQSVISLLQINVGATVWTNNHTCNGVAILYAHLTFDQNVYNGLPTISCDIVGKKVTDLWTVAGVDTWTAADYNNPSWVLFDYLTNTRYGKGIDKSMLDVAAFKQAKIDCNVLVTSYMTKQVTGTSGASVLTVGAAGNTNDCDIGQTVTGTGIQSGSTITAITATTITLSKTLTAAVNGTVTIQVVQKRYVADGHIDTGRPIIDNVKDILTSMNAFLIQSSGKYKVRCNKVEDTSNVYEFDESNITGQWDIALGTKTNRFNQSKITYFEPNNNYQGNIFLVKDATYLAKDNNQTYERALTLPLTCNYTRAAYIGRIIMNQSRYQTTVTFNAVQTALVVEVGDIISITHPITGWTGKLFRVMNMTLQTAGDVRIIAIEYNPAVYSNGTVITAPEFSSKGTYTGGAGAQPNSNLTASVAAPTLASITALTSGRQVSWTKSVDSNIVSYEVTITGNNPSIKTTTSNSVVWATPITATGTTDTVNIVAVNGLGYKSAALTTTITY